MNKFGKAGHGESQIGLGAVGPDIGQQFSATVSDRMNSHDRAGDSVKAGGEHDYIQVEAAACWS